MPDLALRPINATRRVAPSHEGSRIARGMVSHGLRVNLPVRQTCRSRDFKAKMLRMLARCSGCAGGAPIQHPAAILWSRPSSLVPSCRRSHRHERQMPWAASGLLDAPSLSKCDAARLHSRLHLHSATVPLRSEWRECQSSRSGRKSLEKEVIDSCSRAPLARLLQWSPTYSFGVDSGRQMGRWHNGLGRTAYLHLSSRGVQTGHSLRSRSLSQNRRGVITLTL